MLVECDQYDGGPDPDRLSEAIAFRDFTRGVLATAVGSKTGEVPALPVFYRDLPQLEFTEDFASVAAMVTYDEAKEDLHRRDAPAGRRDEKGDSSTSVALRSTVWSGCVPSEGRPDLAR